MFTTKKDADGAYVYILRRNKVHLATKVLETVRQESQNKTAKVLDAAMNELRRESDYVRYDEIKPQKNYGTLEMSSNSKKTLFRKNFGEVCIKLHTFLEDGTLHAASLCGTHFTTPMKKNMLLIEL